MLTDFKAGPLALGVKPSQHMPVISNLVFEFVDCDNLSLDDLYNESMIERLVYFHQKVIKENFKLQRDGTKNENIDDEISNDGEDDDCAQLYCCVLESEKPYKIDDKFIVNIRLVFPYCKVDCLYQERIIRPNVIKLLRSENIFSEMYISPSNDMDQMVDIDFIRKPIPLYGSVTRQEESVLVLKDIYPEINDLNEVITIDFCDLFDPSYCGYVKNGLLDSDIFDKRGDDGELLHNEDFWLPMFLSPGYFNVITSPNDLLVSLVSDLPLSNLASSSGGVSPAINVDNTSDSDMDIAERMIHMISPDRAMNESSWLDIGRALYNCDEDDTGFGFNLWVSFSKNGSRSKSDCDTKWGEFEIKNALDVRTLAWFARKDSQNAYKVWHKDKYEKYMIDSLSLFDDDIAKALYWVYWLDYTCKLTDKKITWYRFKNHRWIPVPKGFNLSKKISNEFFRKYETMHINLLSESRKSYVNNVKNVKHDQADRITKIYKQLKNKNSKGNIMSMAIEYFVDEKFADFENMNYTLFGLPNGVIECVDEKAIFRDGKPQDYITMSSGVKYHPEYTWDTPVVKEYMLWMEQTFTDKDLREYFLKWCASLMHSGNNDKILPCWSGEGNNSKSMMKLLFDIVFGQYSFTLSTEILTKRGAAREGPQKAMASKKKIVLVQEPDHGTTFKSGILKEWTGLDKFFANLLYEDGENMDALFKLIIMANKIPIIPGADKAIIERLRAFPFLSTWKRNAPKGKEEQMETKTFLLNKYFSNKLPFLANGAIWVYVQYYEIYCRDGLIEPRLVREATEQYWEENDIYRHFIRDNIEVAIDEDLITDKNPQGINKNEKVTVSEVYKVFNPWFRESYPSLKLIDQSTMRSILKQRLKNLVGDEWLGYRFKFDAEDMMGGMTYGNYKKGK
uniref:D5-like helicase-primase n=1 Tax=Pithovirus LCPAC101 TaxID=2506586 RepID=A0A481Z4F6_9VIRU|nr:MAG: D5-like helicase-primase [Pithovirus LCPAC101]